MNVLVLGGTVFLGTMYAQVALETSWRVTCFARGQSGAFPSGVHVVKGDRESAPDVTALANLKPDIVIDVASQPGHVKLTAEAFRSLDMVYVFVSSVNVYADHTTQGQDENASLHTPFAGDTFDDPQDYGPAKVACEQILLDTLGEHRTLIVRPGLIGGRLDDTGRSGYWPWRFAHPSTGNRVLIPDALDAPCSLIDADDLVRWSLNAAHRGGRGTYNACGEVLTLGDHLAAARAAGAGDSSREVVAVDETWLEANKVHPWARPGSLPLWLPGTDYHGMTTIDAAAARAEGLTHRPLVETYSGVLDHELARCGFTWPQDSPAGLSDDREREPLALWDARQR